MLAAPTLASCVAPATSSETNLADWRDFNDPPPPPDVRAGDLLAHADRSQVYRAAVPIIAFFGPLTVASSLGGSAVWTLGYAGFTAAAAASRVLLWRQGLAARTLVATEDALVVVERSRVVRWIYWKDLRSLTVMAEMRYAEWRRGGHYFLVLAEPSTEVHPKQAFVGDLVEIFVPRASTQSAFNKIAQAARQHQVVVTLDAL